MISRIAGVRRQASPAMRLPLFPAGLLSAPPDVAPTQVVGAGVQQLHGR